MNAGATRVGDDTVLLCRVEDRRGFSHLTCARSRDGVTNWVVDDAPSLARRRDASRGGVGPRGPARHARRRARALDHRLHRVRPRGPGRLARADRGLRHVRAARHGDGAREQERACCCRGGSTATGCSFHRPTSSQRRRRLDLPLGRPHELARAGAGARPPRRAAGGTRPASASARRRSRREQAGWSSTTACARPSPARSTARAWRCSTSSIPRACCVAPTSGCSARRRRTRCRATSRT